MRITVEQTSWQSEPAARVGLDAGPPSSSADDVVFLLATDMDSGDVVGRGVLRRLDAYTYEIRRVYVVPHWRGRWIGRVLVRQLEQAAREHGATRMRLETRAEQRESVRLYERCGYRRIERFAPYLRCESSICYERWLRPHDDSEAAGPVL